MPIFEFSCEGCGEVFESITGTSLERKNCPVCGSEDISKQVSGFAARTSVQRRGRRVVDLSSNACPCVAHHNHTGAHH